MGLTDQVGERVLFTNCDDLPAVMDARSGFFCIRGNDLERLTAGDLEAIADWLRESPFTPKRNKPRPHQLEALKDILSNLDEHDRVTAVMACATGKTLVALWAAERRNAKRILVLVPSLALVRQTLHEWLKETNWEQPKFIAVVYSMDDPAIYGPIVHTLSFAEAASLGIICNYKIIISVVTSEMINADLLTRGEVIVEGDVVRARAVAHQIAIQ